MVDGQEEADGRPGQRIIEAAGLQPLSSDIVTAGKKKDEPEPQMSSSTTLPSEAVEIPIGHKVAACLRCRHCNNWSGKAFAAPTALEIPSPRSRP